MSAYAYIGKGTLKIKDYGSADALVSLGNASQCNLAITEQSIDLLDYENLGGGKDESLKRIEAVTVQMTLHNISPDNLARAVFGEAGAAVAGDITIEALINAGGEYVLVFEGLNEAKEGRAVTVTMHRVRFGPAQNVPLIGNEFAGLEISGELLRDTAIVTAGLSKYFKVVMEEAA